MGIWDNNLNYGASCAKLISMIQKRTDTPNMPDQTFDGSITTVRRRPTGSGWDMAERMVNPNGKMSNDPQKWIKRTKYAKTVSDALRARGNRAYNVPRTFSLFNRFRDQWVPGVPLRKLYGTDYLVQNETIILNAMAEMINDMSELYPTYVADQPMPIPQWFKNRRVLKDTLIEASDVIPTTDAKTIQDVYDTLMNLPENRQMIFHHCDMHPDNILVDPKTNTVSFIDFERAGYISKFYATYFFGPASSPQLWDIVNKLPRAKNPLLIWSYNDNIKKLIDLLSDATWELINYSPLGMPDDLRDEFVKKIQDIANKMRFIMGKLRIEKTKPQPVTTLVTRNHYER